MASKKKIFAALSIFILLITIFNFSSAANKLDIANNDPEHDGYIIQLIDEPLLKFENQLKERINLFFSHFTKAKQDTFLKEKLNNHKEKLEILHNQFKSEISRILQDNYDYKKSVISEFFELFNGICIKNIDNEKLEEIKNLPFVKNVFPNSKIKINLDKSIPIINSDEIWQYHDKDDKSLTGQGIKIAIIDTGVNYNHPDFKGRYMGGYDFANDDADPMDDHYTGHGTHCAGIALGSGKVSNYQYVGVAPMASLYAYKVIKANGEGYYSWLLDALTQAVNDGVDIISLSLGDNSSGVNPDDPLSQAADAAVEAGVIVVAAAGNDGPSGPINSPGCARKVICVGATDDYDNIASFSSRGPVIWGEGNNISKPDVVAPGVSIRSTGLFGGYTTKQGTSMATPHVAGAAALILQNNSDLNPAEVKSILMNTSVDIGEDNSTQGSGRINLSAAIKVDHEIIIKSPYRVSEEESFSVSIEDNQSKPLNSLIILQTPLHLVRIRYGAYVDLTAPTIFRTLKATLQGKIYIVNFQKKFLKKVDIAVTNV